ncbi:MAG: hypothetical protein FWD94_06055 [Treponema sp.]|jgi:hypothetical protein|nr:hypothetical protein [Treponema sp.]
MGIVLLALGANLALAQGEDVELQQPGRDTQVPQQDPRRSRQGGHHLPRMRGQTFVLDIAARVVEQDQTVSWKQAYRALAIPGHPVEVRLVGTNLAVAAKFTLYVRHETDHFLVAQGEVWMQTADQGVRYHASVQTIPLDFGEDVHFFPLGPVRGGVAAIEIVLSLQPYDESEE